MARHISHQQSLLLFTLLAIIFSAISVWLVQNGYLNDSALLRWAKVRMLLDADEIRLEHIGLMYPHLPIYLLIPFFYIPNLATPIAPYLLSALVGALLLTLWNQHLSARISANSTRWALVLLAACHPLFLWSITSGSEKALSLLMFYLLCYSLIRTARYQDMRSIILLGVVLATYFFIDERTLFLFIALLPLIPLCAPQRMLRYSPISVYTIISLPLAAAILSWLYLNWIFHGDPWLFLTAPESSFLGAKLAAHESRWLMSVGGEWLMPILISLLWTLTSYPVLIWLTLRTFHNRQALRNMVVFFLHPMLAVGIATSSFFLVHPIEMLFIFSAGVMAATLMLPPLRPGHQRITLAAMMLSIAGGWLTLYGSHTPDMLHWRQAMAGPILGEGYAAADNRLGQWLSAHRAATMIDDRVAFRAIAARGDAKGLLLPFMIEFKQLMRWRSPQAEQIVTLDPAHPQAHLDTITQNYPRLFQHGAANYRLVFEQEHWRVYRRRGS
ncbi:hypothetical protein JYT31_00510 [Beggiatoa alba]|nr:hypothetical protein [Beggiatoa alba]